MDSLIDASQKIKKKPRNSSAGERNYTCGGCQKSYKSYPALYLHIKRKHNGIRPPDTKTSKPITPALKDKIHTGRPQKPSHDIDKLNEVESYIEELQNDLLGFLGETIGSLSTLEAKPKLENVLDCVMKIANEQKEEWLDKIKQQSQDTITEIKENSPNDIDIHLDYEDIKDVAGQDPLKAAVWFILWLGRYNVKLNFVPDVVIIFSKILKILANMKLEIPDLDNKLVWNNVIRECEPLMSQFTYFNQNKDLVFEFIKRICHLIGKTFE